MLLECFSKQKTQVSERQPLFLFDVFALNDLVADE
jgi:hypothetical protein